MAIYNRIEKIITRFERFTVGENVEKNIDFVPQIVVYIPIFKFWDQDSINIILIKQIIFYSE